VSRKRARPHERAAAAAERERRRQQVVAGLLAGLSIREMAKGLGVSHSTIAEDIEIVRAEWREARVASYDDLVTQEAARLDKLQSRFWQSTLDGDPQAAAVVLRCMDRRARLLGLDAAQKLQVDAAVDVRGAILTSPEWQELRALILGALADHPQARIAVVEAIGALPPPSDEPDGEEEEFADEDEEADGDQAD
jgi:DNA-binding transcriptional MocR family regulator